MYESLYQLQQDLDAWLVEYNEQRPHSGNHCYGKTPKQTLIDSVPLAKEKPLNNTQQTDTPNAAYLSDQILATALEHFYECELSQSCQPEEPT